MIARFSFSVLEALVLRSLSAQQANATDSFASRIVPSHSGHHKIKLTFASSPSCQLLYVHVSAFFVISPLTFLVFVCSTRRRVWPVRFGMFRV